jgi:hypothetical protein
MSGKSTLTEALVAAGATYLSDEFAVVTAEGTVAAYPRRVTTRSGASTRRHLPPGAAGAEDPPVSVRLIADLTFSERGWEVETVSAGRAVTGAWPTQSTSGAPPTPSWAPCRRPPPRRRASRAPAARPAKPPPDSSRYCAG